MTYIEKMLKGGIPVNWLTIKIGWDGPGNYTRLLSTADVIAYAGSLFEDDAEQPAEVLKLASAYDGEEGLVDACIRKLASEEKSQPSLEIRKWRLVLLEDHLKTLGDDPLYGLMGLNEFWAGFGYPNDSPQIISDYTPENYQSALEAHGRWIDKERSILTQSH